MNICGVSQLRINLSRLLLLIATVFELNGQALLKLIQESQYLDEKLISELKPTLASLLGKNEGKNIAISALVMQQNQRLIRAADDTFPVAQKAASAIRNKLAHPINAMVIFF